MREIGEMAEEEVVDVPLTQFQRAEGPIYDRVIYCIVARDLPERGTLTIRYRYDNKYCA